MPQRSLPVALEINPSIETCGADSNPTESSRKSAEPDSCSRWNLLCLSISRGRWAHLSPRELAPGPWTSTPGALPPGSARAGWSPENTPEKTGALRAACEGDRQHMGACQEPPAGGRTGRRGVDRASGTEVRPPHSDAGDARVPVSITVCRTRQPASLGSLWPGSSSEAQRTLRLCK